VRAGLIVDSVPDLDDAGLLELALTTAREAGALVAGLRERGVDVADTKSSPVDVVTAADRACEELIRERLLGARPADGFIGEEGEDVASTSGVTWVVDPIDGTVNYLYGIPQYAVSIAAVRGDRVVAGVVRNPAADLEYAARLGGGATCNGTPLGVRTTPPLDQALVGTGFGYEGRARARQGRAAARMLPRVRDIRRQGSCALDLCAVAAGMLDAYVEEGPHLWDHAAGALVAAEAGARVEIWPTPAAMDLVVAAPEDGWSAFSALVRDCGYLDDSSML
jgi:myo-inositol-1(or 4)-monophosphatase